LVEQKARLELPADVHAVVGGDLAALVPDADETVEASFRVEVLAGGLEEVGRLDRVHTNGLDAETGTEDGEAEESGDIGDGVLIEDRRPRLLEAPQIDRDARERQAVIGDLLLEPLPVGARRVRVGRRVRPEAAQLDAVVAEVL